MNELVSYYGGMDSNLYVTKQGAQTAYQISPQGSAPGQTSMSCITGCINCNPFMFSAFPPNLASFDYAGQQTVEGELCNVWTSFQPHSGMDNANYTFYVSASSGQPVQYEYIGLLGGSANVGFANSPNYDYFLISYTAYEANPSFNSSVFAVPNECGHTDRSANVATPRHLAHRYGMSVDSDELFDEYKAAHGKTYKTTAEHAHRKGIYMTNLHEIHLLNLKHQQSAFAANHLADRTPAERRMRRMEPQHYSGKLPADAVVHEAQVTDLKSLPQSWDWRDHGAVLGVLEQGDCGACWTFGATESLSGTYFVKHGELLAFSQQFIMDCTWPEGNEACNGGSPGAAYKGVQRLGGWPLAADYPYLMNDGKCHKAPANVTIKERYNVKPFDKTALLDALVSKGPIAIAVDAQPVEWDWYHAGVMSGFSCNPTSLDHEVLLVGYDFTDSSNPFVIIKNSWSTYWGIDGFVQLDANHNFCGFSTNPQYAEPN